ncbi:uncharacterized protein LOC113862309 [Abrus precatorius]|uniref:Uncharacterized protein LOC113862309 n=1 Tax=Abrus precatorius TaxID=3816 RepID=A0A8B8L4S9_ABRPR|nr:uncharacterized protein LOC113862309 [Abrus precatorius]
MKRDVTEYVARCLTCQKAKTRNNHDAIWMIVDWLTKAAYFLQINMKYKLERLANLYVQKIVRLHGVSISVVSDRDLRFTSRFWESLQRELGTKLRLSSAYHPQTDSQTDIITMLVLGWRHLRLCMGRGAELRCVGMKLGKWFCVSPVTGVGRALKSQKLSLKFIGPFEQYVSDPSHVIDLDSVQVREDLSYDMHPVRKVDLCVKQLRGKEISLVKVLSMWQWRLLITATANITFFYHDSHHVFMSYNDGAMSL